jgi:hypothetical protein
MHFTSLYGFPRRSVGRHFLPAAVGVLLLLVGLLAAGPQTGRAQGTTQQGGLPTLEQRVAALESRATADQAKIAALESKVADLQSQINTIKLTPEKIAILDAMSLSGTELTITGVNVRIVNGLGNTRSVNGLGNLTIGYNELRTQLSNRTDDDRSGSHNLIVGEANNYSSYGGLVAGGFNTVSGVFASVSGGEGNTASGPRASVSGGATNVASGDRASVSGGTGNTASNLASSVSGGQSNLASGGASSISGGSANTASGTFASVIGGQHNVASGESASVSGGNVNVAGGLFATVSGGVTVQQNNDGGWAAGGRGAGTYHSP